MTGKFIFIAYEDSSFDKNGETISFTRATVIEDGTAKPVVLSVLKEFDMSSLKQFNTYEFIVSLIPNRTGGCSPKIIGVK